MPDAVTCHASTTVTEPGDYSVTVEYKKDGKVASDMREPIAALEADLQMEGLQESKEQDPGGFLCVGGARRRVDLKYFYFEPFEQHLLALALPDGLEAWDAETDGSKLAVFRWDDHPHGSNNWAAKPDQVWLQAVSPGSGTVRLDYNGKAPANRATHTDTIKVTGVTVDLAATDLDGAVSQLEEENPGAFVHYNVDNDNSSDNSQGAPKHPGGDYLEEGPITGEDDLLPVTMAFAPDLHEGVVTLARSDSSVRVWKSAQKGAGNEVLVDQNTKDWDLADSQQRAEFVALWNSLYVEGADGGVGGLALFYFPPGGAQAINDLIVYRFIAADCGNQPRTDNGQRQRFEVPFPLVRCEWSCTAPPSGVYNCIAWSVDETGVWYNKLYHNPPVDIGIDKAFGNDDGEFELSDMNAFYLDRKGWTPSAQGAADAQAIYYSGFHAARKRICACGGGQWLMFESKCGEGERIEHVWDQLSGGPYGSPVRFYK